MWKELQAGHFYHSKLDFEPLNIHPQCVYCNHHIRGNLNVYATNLVRDHGAEVLEFIKKEVVRKGNDYSRSELEEIILTCKQQEHLWK